MREIVTKNGRVRRYRSPEEIAAVVREFEAGGLSRTEFARKHGLNGNVLARWLNRAAEAAEGVPVFQEVRVPPLAPPAASGWAAEVALGSGVTLRLAPAASPELVVRLWQLISR